MFPYLRQGNTMTCKVLVPLVISPKVTLTDEMSRGLECQKCGVACPCLPYFRQDESMLFDVRVPLVIRPEVTTNG